MTEYGGAGAHRVLLRQALGGDEFVRVTWHEHNDVFVFSLWSGATCTAATPVRVSELGELASMTVAALARRAALGGPERAAVATASPWPAPSLADRRPAGPARPA